ncbi:helix-turn-helix domain-containing protein [Spongiactinospora sp. TRM90649]|uniref:PucR family transcriptional regulator n=1 Tax=Spongiactinospora sp. TRM90649 TaxID=3031114 RepID=UPI0023F783D6|nr:helix-turn-helix domain-containing protein [Spongiactinospora sp. TRM90649]MDF5754600.1 helix-turn-helix domain-containing protein [Spongiactinospora sp. TRM90649]
MSLDETVQELADRLGVALVVLDHDLKVAAFSVHDTDARLARLARLLAGSAAPVTESLVREHRLRQAEHGVRVSRPGGELVVLPLRHEQHLIGYVYYVEDRATPRPGDLEALESAAPEIGVLLALRISDRRHGEENSRQLLAELLGESPAARSKAAETLVRDNFIEDVEHYAVLVLRAPESSSKSLTRLAVEATLEFTRRSTTVKIVGAVLGAEGIVLFPRPVNHDRLERALAGPGLEAVVAGVGSVKPSLTEAVDSYHEARLAHRASSLDPSRYGKRVFWDDLGLDRLFLQLPLDRLTPSQFPAGVRRLLDAPHGAELAATLEGYLDSGGEIQGAARRLSIHRSTLYYRLDRIRELTGCDITDGSIRLELHAGLRIARLTGLWPHE